MHRCITHLRGRCALGACVRGFGAHRWQSTPLANALQANETAVGRYRARTLMRERGLRPVWRRRFVTTTQRDERATVAGNHLDRQFAPASPEQA